MNRAAALAAAVLIVTGPAPADSLDAPTLKRLEQALACVNLTIEDLGWDKRPLADDFRLACVNQVLDRPLALADRAVNAESAFADDPAASARAAAAWLDVSVPAPADFSSSWLPSAGARADGRFAGAPGEAAALLALLVRGYEEASRLREEALGALSPAERELLAVSGARLYTEESEEDWDMPPVLAAASKVDMARLVRAEMVLADTARAARQAAAGLDSARWRSRTWRLGKITVGLGGPGPDTHRETVVLDAGGDDTYASGAVVLDLAGRDVYRGMGSGLFAVALLVDLAGDDLYEGKNFVQGGAAFGVSLLLDVAGNDRYEAEQCSQGAAFFGVGMLFDLAGSDAYRGARFVQGFGGTRGLGVLSDVAGNDTYYAGGKYPHAPLLPENYQSLSQGFGFGLRGASASGGVGILADHAGNDVYAAEVFGQGASYWFSLGILVDSAGHDKYNLYQYGQGAGIHLSAGVLLDRGGNDAYSCNNGVAQGSGHDWGVGLLWDMAGDDCYQGSGMSQGGANANGIGMLLERAGNDSYAGWNVKNQGDAFFARGTIGLGALLDLGGKDRYTHGGSDGALWTRGTVGVGFDSENGPSADESGKGAAPAEAPRSAATSRGPGTEASQPEPAHTVPKDADREQAVGHPGPDVAKRDSAEKGAAHADAPRPAATASSEPAARSQAGTAGTRDEAPHADAPRSAVASTGSAAMHEQGTGLASVGSAATLGTGSVSEAGDLPSLWREACLWEVGSNTAKVPRARSGLIAAGERALEFLIPAKLATKDTLVTRALNVVITGIGKRAVGRLVACLASEQPDVRRNAAELLGALGASEAAPAIAGLLADPDARLGALAALGQLKSPAAAVPIANLMDSDAPERVRATAAATLGAIGGQDAVVALARHLASPAAAVGYAAQFALEALKATGALRARLGDPDLRTRLHAVAALGHIADASARADLLPLLADPSPVVRGFAAEALGPLLEASDRPLLQARMAAEADPFVRGKLAAALEPK